MSNGFGAAFGGLLLVAVVSGLAGLLGLCLLGAVISRRQTGTVPRALQYLSIVVVLGVLLVAGFAVAALYDEAAVLAAVFVASIFAPLGGVGIYLYRVTDLSRSEILATAGRVWSLPFLLGIVVTFGSPVVITGMFGMAPAEARQLGVYWGATALGGIVVLLGALWLCTYVSEYSSTPS